MSQSVLAVPTATRRRPPAALLALAALFLVALVGRFVFTLAEPPFNGSLDYDDLRALDGGYGPLNLYLGGPSYLLSFLATAVFLVLLGRGRGSVLTLVGGLCVGLGGVLFSLAITAEALPFGYASDSAVFGEAQGRALVDVFNAQDQLLPAIVGSQIAIGLGGLIGLVGVLVSRTAPRWFPIAGVVFVLVSQGLPVQSLGQPVIVLDYLMQLVLLGGIGWFGLRAASRSREVGS